jgi:hypothetical protein
MAFNLWMMATANQSNDPSVLIESGHPDRGTVYLRVHPTKYILQHTYLAQWHMLTQFRAAVVDKL